MGDQCFSIQVPNTNVTIQGGAGAVAGVSITTDENEFFHAGVEMILESASDMRCASTGAFGAAATGGILIGTPATIQHSAGGGIQIYAGAGITPSIGSANGPGAGFGASAPAQVNAGARADSLNAFNDFVKAGSDVAGAVMSYQGATDAIGKASAVFSGAKGAWDATKAATGTKNDTVDTIFAAGGMGFGAVNAANALGNGDNVGAATGAIGWVAGLATFVAGEEQKSNAAKAKAAYGEALSKAEAARAARSELGGKGGSLGPPADGPRIHEVAPANIDRECGADMTAKVGGDKTATVDGSITYKSGNSISMKAFSAISTSSLTFSAHANVSASMKGLATAKVESFGSASLDGKAKFSVSSKGAGSISAPKIDIKTSKLTVTSSQTKIGPGKVDIGPGPVTIDSVTTINKKTEIKGILQVAKKTEIKGALHVNNRILAKGEIKGNSTLKNSYFKAG